MIAPTHGLDRKGGGLLDPAPLVALIQRDARRVIDEWDGPRLPKTGFGILSRETGIAERQLYRLVVGESRHVELDLADLYCCRTGRHLSEVYPRLYEDEQIEADLAERERLDAGTEAERRDRRNARRRQARAAGAAA